jgi:hypothetical protein
MQQVAAGAFPRSSLAARRQPSSCFLLLFLGVFVPMVLYTAWGVSTS